MRRFNQVFLIICAAFCISSLHAYTNNCENAAGWATKLECSNAKLNRLENELDRVYNQFIKDCNKSSVSNEYWDHGDGKGRVSNASVIIERMKLAQSTWMNWRNRECDLNAAIYLNGSMEWDERRHCLIDMTEKRISKIKNNNLCPN